MTGDSGLVLWCGLGGLAYYPQEGNRGDLERFLDRCLQVGVSELSFYFGFAHTGQPTVFRLSGGQSPFDLDASLASFFLYRPGGWDPWNEMVQAVQVRGLRLTAYTSPNYQGILQPNAHSPLGERLPFLYLSEFANRHPDAWVRDDAGRTCLERDGYVILDLTQARVRQHLAQELGKIGADNGIHNLELEWLCGTEKTSPYVGDDPDHAAAGTTALLRQIRNSLKPGQGLSVAVEDDLARARSWSYDVEQWAGSGLVDRVVLRHRGRDVPRMAERVRAARALLGPEVELVSQIDCWQANGLGTGSTLRRALDGIRETGTATGGNHRVGIYRADAIEALGLWKHLEGSPNPAGLAFL